MQKTRKAYPLTGTPYLINQIRHKFANSFILNFRPRKMTRDHNLISNYLTKGGGGGVNSGGWIYTETQGVEVYI